MLRGSFGVSLGLTVGGLFGKRIIRLQLRMAAGCVDSTGMRLYVFGVTGKNRVNKSANGTAAKTKEREA